MACLYIACTIPGMSASSTFMHYVQVPEDDPRAENAPVGKGLRATQDISKATCVGFYRWGLACLPACLSNTP